MPSLKERLALTPADEREQFITRASAETIRLLADNDWSVIARPDQQQPPGDWTIWMVCTGRAWGKTRTAAEWSVRRVQHLTAQIGEPARWAVIGATFGDMRDIMVEGESGLLSVLPPSSLRQGSVEASWNRSLGELVLFDGSILRGFSAEKPERLRGPQFHGGWADEIASWKDAPKGPAADTTWSNFMLSLRLPPDPRAIVTTTPKANTLVRDLLDDESGTIVYTRGSLYDNAHNLAPAYRDYILSHYEGSRLGRQEVHGELLADMGSVFHTGWFSVVDEGFGPDAERIRYWDLAATEESPTAPDPDWTVGALVAHDHDTRTYCIEDIRRKRATSGAIENLVVETAHVDGRDVRIGIEQEPGSAGKSVIRHFGRLLDGYRFTGHRPTGPKVVRAEIVASAAEQERVSIVRRDWLRTLLDELEEFDGGAHDDQVDALSGAWDLLGEEEFDPGLLPVGAVTPSAWRSV